MWFLLATKQSTGGCRLCWNLSGTKSLEGRITARSGAGWDGGWITRGSPCVFRVDWRKNIWGRSFGTHVSCWGGLNCWNWLNLMQISRGQFLEGFPLSRSVGVGNDPLCGFKWRSYGKNIWEHEWWWVFNTKIEGKSGELRASVAMRQIWVVCLRFRLLYDIYNRFFTPVIWQQLSVQGAQRSSGEFSGMLGGFGGCYSGCSIFKLEVLTWRIQGECLEMGKNDHDRISNLFKKKG